MPLNCAICGRSDSIISKSRNLCLDCFLSEGLFQDIKKIELTICPSCYSIKTINWKRVKTLEDINSYIESYISRKLKTKEGVYLKNVKFSINENFSFGIANITLLLKDFDLIHESKAKIELKINKRLCNDCLNLKTENYSAILQIRDSDLTTVSKIEREMEELLGNSQEIIKYERFHYGNDIYFLHVNVARKIARTLAKKYYCRYEESFSVRSKNRHVYTILLDLR